MGIGHFIGLMSHEMRSRSKITGVEIDPTSAAIAERGYPAQISSCAGVHEFKIAPGSFDVAIGNPPFGSKSLFDAEHPDLRHFSIHNYFFAKSLKALRPNGILAMVVSSSMMDKRGEAQREWIFQHAELLGAVRLPSNAFKQNALTEVTTDIIFLRRRGEEEKPDPGLEHQWLELAEVTGKDGVRYRINTYFAEHPEMMLGEIGPNEVLQTEAVDGVYDSAPGLHGPFDAAMLQSAIERLPRNFYKAGRIAEEVRRPHILVSDVGFAQPFGYTLDDQGQAVRRLPDLNGEKLFEPVLYADRPLEGLRLERFKGMLQIRDGLRLLIRAEIDDSSEMQPLRGRLNKTYDEFVKKFGCISSSANTELFRDDPTDFPLLRALEVNYDKGVSKTEAARTGEAPKPPSAEKAAIFRVRTREPYRSAIKADSAKDALAIVLREDGIADMDRITMLVGKEEEAVAQELAGLLFFNPKSNTWETADVYLSGNVKRKLAEAREAAKQDLRYLDNVRSLEKIQPEDVPAEKIFFQIGATWIPTRIYEEFAQEILQSNTVVRYNADVNVWSVIGDSHITTAFQTDKMSAVDIFKDLLRNKDIAVFDRDGDGVPFIQMEWTTQARAKADDMQRAFVNWALEKPERRDIVAREFNAKVNTHVEMKPDGSHMVFPGMGVIKPGVKRDDQLEPHQKNAVWRMIQRGEGLLDHTVGSGKTFAAVAAGMEMKRMGLLKKPVYIVPNHLVQQWAIEFQRLYPGANVLVIGKKDFAKARRQEFIGRIATGSWDAVLMAHSSFGFIKTPHEYEVRFYKDQLDQYKHAITAMRAADGKKLRSVKQMEAARDRLEEKLKELATKPRDAVADFSELGVDALFIDEAHEFKNLFYATSRTRVAGLGNPTGSKKAFDMFVKTQFIRDQNNGRGVFFLTGTPVSNSIAEMYTMMRYLRYDRLKEMGIKHFDQWANMFAKTVSDWEVDPSGTRYRLQAKMEFANLPGLMALYKDFADVITRSDLKEMAKARGQVWPIPDIKNGKPANVVAERSDFQKNFMDWIVYRFDHMPEDPRKDNPLKATTEAMKGALDIRLIKPELPDFEGSKVNLAVRNIVDIYKNWDERKGTQLVFCDLSVPQASASKVRAEIMALRESIKKAEEALAKADGSDPDHQAQLEQEYIDLTEQFGKYSPTEIASVDSGFSVYDDVKAKLMSVGIPSSEIAFIHDANTDLQKEALFEKVRSGRVRVLIGSTSKMGAGMNVQNRLVALHHLDAPWRPADLEQREGRIVRQGNLFYAEALAKGEKFEVEIFRYATNQTLDTRRWQVIERKAVSIAALRSKDHEWGTTLEDALGEAANAAEMKAASSGNPLILEEIKLRQEIKKLEALRSGSRSQRWSMESKIREAETFEGTFEQTIKDYWANKAFIESHPKDRTPEGWEITLNDQAFKAVGLVAVPGVVESDDKEAVRANKAAIKAAAENNEKALKLAKAKYANALSDTNAIESIRYRSVDFVMRKTYYGYVLQADLDSMHRYDSALQEIHIDTRKGDSISPDGLIIRLDNYLGHVASSAETLTKWRADRLASLSQSAKNAREELAKIEDFEPALQHLRTKHSAVIGALEQERKSSPNAKPDMSLWDRGGRSLIDDLTPAGRESSTSPEPGADPNGALKRGGEMDSGVPSVATLIRASRSVSHSSPSAVDPRQSVHPQTFAGKITMIDGAHVYQEMADGKVAKHGLELFRSTPQVGECYKIIYRRGVGRVEGLVSVEQAAKLSCRQGRSLS
ncbi:MAG: helicase-related protein [Desulfobacteraceae bacterium]|nr:helicase-related protein [Desulfobacteraceae bacterium]